MSRPRTEPPNRTSTAIRLRPAIYERLKEAANDRELSMNWLINKAVEQFLDELIPVDEIVRTRKVPPTQQGE